MASSGKINYIQVRPINENLLASWNASFAERFPGVPQTGTTEYALPTIYVAKKGKILALITSPKKAAVIRLKMVRPGALGKLFQTSIFSHELHHFIKVPVFSFYFEKKKSSRASSRASSLAQRETKETKETKEPNPHNEMQFYLLSKWLLLNEIITEELPKPESTFQRMISADRNQDPSPAQDPFWDIKPSPKVVDHGYVDLTEDVLEKKFEEAYRKKKAERAAKKESKSISGR